MRNGPFKSREFEIEGDGEGGDLLSPRVWS